MRLDKFLVENKNIKTRSKALDLIKRKLVKVNDEIITKAGYEVKEVDNVVIIDNLKYVSRAGLKLEEALIKFNISLENKIVVDVGTSTGGFSDCALKNKAKFVYGYDVGTNQLDDSLKNIKNLKIYEQTNILDVTDFHDNDIFLIDVSFTSIIPILEKLVNYKKEIICLIKPQFEVGINNLKKGIVKNKKTAYEAVLNIENFLKTKNYYIFDMFESSLKGKDGNQEFLAYLIPSFDNSINDGVNNTD